jgi:hypothetical protein
MRVQVRCACNINSQGLDDKQATPRALLSVHIREAGPVLAGTYKPSRPQASRSQARLSHFATTVPWRVKTSTLATALFSRYTTMTQAMGVVLV